MGAGKAGHGVAGWGARERSWEPTGAAVRCVCERLTLPQREEPVGSSAWQQLWQIDGW